MRRAASVNGGHRIKRLAGQPGSRPTTAAARGSLSVLTNSPVWIDRARSTGQSSIVLATRIHASLRLYACRAKFARSVGPADNDDRRHASLLPPGLTKIDQSLLSGAQLVASRVHTTDVSVEDECGANLYRIRE